MLHVQFPQTVLDTYAQTTGIVLIQLQALLVQDKDVPAVLIVPYRMPVQKEMVLVKATAPVTKCKLRMVAKEKVACAVQKLPHAQLPQLVQGSVQTAIIVQLPWIMVFVVEQDVLAALTVKWKQIAQRTTDRAGNPVSPMKAYYRTVVKEPITVPVASRIPMSKPARHLSVTPAKANAWTENCAPQKLKMVLALAIPPARVAKIAKAYPSAKRSMGFARLPVYKVK